MNITAGGGVTIAVPLEALVQLPSSSLENLLDQGVSLAYASQKLPSGLLERKPFDDLNLIRDEIETASIGLGNTLSVGFAYSDDQY
ncbi:MAG: hypothetical protein ACMUIA_04975 [bacterium]